MKWPWVSRLAYDLLVDERDRLRAQNDDLLQTLKGIRRVGAGLKETPRKPKEQVQREPIPREIRELYLGFSSAGVSALDFQVDELRRNGHPWPEIKKLLERQLETAGAM